MRAIRLRGVIEKTGLAKTTIYRLEQAGKFPKRFKLGELASAWDEAEVDAWLEARAATRGAPTPSEASL